MNLNELTITGQFSIDLAHTGLYGILPDMASTFDEEEVSL
jgi:hypothetical protein